jgi:Zn-dependent M28 family amino/carboxypeptidase
MLPFRDRRAPMPLAVAALGGSVPTPLAGVTAEVVEVTSLSEALALGERAKGKIVFYNRPMDPATRSTFAAYGNAVDQRSRGAIEAARSGAVAVLVRSMTTALDNVPHTGTLSYAEGVPKIPAAAVSTEGAESLSRLLRRDPHARVRLTLDCKTLPDVPSANVVGEIRGKEFPDEIIVIGGHLDAWDKGHGAHDDGSGCMHAIEVLSLFKRTGIVPKRTVRAVMFMNEENGSRGGPAYASNPARRKEKTVAAIESDRGGFTPRGFTMSGDSTRRQAVLRWRHMFEGGSGVDVAPLVEHGAMGFGLDVDDHRYFDYHHSANDTVDKVHWRELEYGAIATAFLCYLISEEGL